MGLLEPVWRLPMTPPQATSKQKIEAVLQNMDCWRERRVTAAAPTQLPAQLKALLNKKPAALQSG